MKPTTTKSHKYLVQIQPGGAHGFEPDKFAKTIEWAIHTHTRDFFGGHYPEITVTREEVAGRPAARLRKAAATTPAKPHAATCGTPAALDPRRLPVASKLGALAPALVGRLSRELTRAFDATVWALGPLDARCFFVEFVDHRRVAFDADCLVSDLWSAVALYEDQCERDSRKAGRGLYPR